MDCEAGSGINRNHVTSHTLVALNFAGLHFTLLPMDQANDTFDDWAAARQAAKGDSAAFKQLFDRHSGALFRFLASRIGRADAEEALSDVWLNAWRAIKGGKFTETHFRGWVFQIARNQIIDRLRKGSRNTRSLEADETGRSEPALPDLSSEINRRLEDLRDCVGELPHEYASVVNGYLFGEAHQMIAKSLSIPLGTSHSRLSKAKPLLRQCMERKGWDA